MTDRPDRKGIFGIVLLLLILGGQNRGPGGLTALGKNLRLDSFARDMHRIVAMMDQMEGLTQMVGMGQLASAASALSAPSSGSHISGAADSVANALSDTFSSMNGQDLGQLMEMAGPLMELFGSQGRK